MQCFCVFPQKFMNFAAFCKIQTLYTFFLLRINIKICPRKTKIFFPYQSFFHKSWLQFACKKSQKVKKFYQEKMMETLNLLISSFCAT